jgi:DNA polymerase-3 subunit epsilon
MPALAPPPFVQRSFDEMGTPLCDVTFVVLDLETTGASPATDAITEVGAIKLRGGECLGTLQTLVNPGVPIPPAITYLTGITEAMVLPAPPIDTVLPALLEFVHRAVIVGHNVRFDLSFLQAVARAGGYPRLDHAFVDTCALARRLIREEVPDCRLSTLAAHFRTTTRPTHRALDDARATGEVLHALLERAGTLGVLALDDLLALPTVKGHPQLNKLKLVARLPRAPGVYVFRDAGGRPLYVGKATDLRRRVRSYFSGDERRKVGQLLRELATIDHQVCDTTLEAAVLEVRLIHQLSPRFNRQAKLWRRYAYVKLTLDDRWPRLSVVRSARAGDGCIYVGPLPSAGAARTVAEAIETAVPLRRCRGRVPADPAGRRAAPCTPAQLGVASCPCAGTVTADEYAAYVETTVRGLTTEPDLLLDPLERRMRQLAAAHRFEEAADVRDRAAALARALSRQRRLDALVRAGRLVVEGPGGERALLDRGRLVSSAGAPPPPAGPPDGDPAAPLPTALVDEVACVSSWLEAAASRLRVVDCTGGLAWPLPRLPRFEPVGVTRSRRV